MKKIGKSAALLTVLLMMTVQVWAAQVQFNATVDRNEVEEGEDFTLHLTVSADGNVNEDEEPRLPTLDGFELVNKYSQSEASSVFENGKFSFVRKQVYNYILSAQKKGTLTIGPAEVKVNGQVLTSKPIQIKVVAAGAGRPQAQQNQARRGGGRGQNPQAAPDDDESMPGNPFNGFDDDENDLFSQLLRRRGLIPDKKGGVKSAPHADSQAFFITAEADKRKVYVGEEIVVNWYLYTRGGLQAYDALKYPELHGFWKEDLEMASRLNFQQEVVNGVPYNKALLVSYAIFPITPGRKVIDSYKAKATVVEMDSAMSMFGLGHPYTFTKASEELPIEVMPLPTEGRPASFSGAVGTFNITGSLSADQVKVNQPVSLKIRFQGRGNSRQIELPGLDLPKTLEVYDTKKDSQFARNGDSYKEFEVLLIPRAQGDMTIPPIPLSYFDPKQGKYVTAQTPEFKLKVLPGDGSNQNNFNVPLAKQGEGAAAGEAPADTKDIRFLKTTPGLAFSPGVQRSAWILLFLLVYGWFGYQIWLVTTGRASGQTSILKRRVKLKLKAAQAKLKAQDWRGVGVESSNAVLSTLGEVSGAGGGSITMEEMLQRLPPESKPLQERVRKFLNRCEIVSFAPQELVDQFRKTGKGDAEVKGIISEAEAIIAGLFQLGKRERSYSPAAASEAGQRTS